jgi:ATP-binding cassette subfamily B protein
MNKPTDTNYTYLKFLKHLFVGNYISLSLLILVQVVSGICPVLTSYLIAQLIDTITLVKEANTHIEYFGIHHITIVIVSCSIFLLFDEVFAVVHGLFSDYFKDYIHQKVKFLFLSKISLHPTNDFFENPKISDLVSLSKTSVQDISGYVYVVSYFLSGLFAFISSLIAVWTFEWWIPLVLIITLIPLIYFRITFQKKTWNIRESFSSLFKQMDIYEECLTSAHYSKDIRLYNMQPKILDAWNDCYSRFFNAVNRIRKTGSIIILLLSIISGIGVAICFSYVASNALVGKFTLGDLSFLFGLTMQLRGSIASLIYGGTELLKVNLAITPLLEILNIGESTEVVPVKPTSILQYHSDDLLYFQNVTFSYQGSSKSILDKITLSIKKGTSVAIVGENGAGKTTLVKLICRFYVPSDGRILWQGKDIKTLEFNQYRSQVSVLLQDFAQFPLSVRDNINIRRQDIDNTQIQKLLDKVGLKSLLQDKLGNILSKSVEEGIELSGGQWQRLALTRMLADLSNNNVLELLIFDEPTSALDPNAEHEVIELIRQMIKQKTSIVISHRLALTRFVDRILVMERGRIVEDGDHVSLMESRGLYYRMFTKQASYYVGPEFIS